MIVQYLLLAAIVLSLAIVQLNFRYASPLLAIADRWLRWLIFSFGAAHFCLFLELVNRPYWVLVAVFFYLVSRRDPLPLVGDFCVKCKPAAPLSTLCDQYIRGRVAGAAPTPESARMAQGSRLATGASAQSRSRGRSLSPGFNLSRRGEHVAGSSDLSSPEQWGHRTLLHADFDHGRGRALHHRQSHGSLCGLLSRKLVG